MGLDSIICTTTDRTDDVLEEIANNTNILIFKGHIENKLMRWRYYFHYFDLDNFHLIDAVDPFFDCELMIHSSKLLRSGYDM